MPLFYTGVEIVVCITEVHQEAASPFVSEGIFMSARVLIADPDEYLLDNCRNYLEQQGFEVATATPGLECVKKLRACAPDILVLEPSIPWGHGDGVLAMMYEEPDVPLVPVIVLTYGRDRGALYRLAPFKIDDYQVKPLRPQQLAERIRTVARRQKFETIAIKLRQSPAVQKIVMQP